MSVEISITDQIVEINEVSNPVEISISAGAAVAQWGSITGTLSNQTDLQNALNLKVPYTGATANVDLGEYELKAGQIELDQTPTGTAGVAVTRWNDSTGTIETTLKGGSVVLEHGRDMFERIVNKTGIQLTKAAYQAVRVSNAQGQRLAVQLAQANNDNNSADTIGLVVETIDNNQEGYIYTVGEIDGVNTTGTLQGETWVDGDVLYLSPTTAGRITNIKPVAPQHLVIIGYVIYAHQNNGKIYVKVMNGWELGELHDVNTTGATNGQVLKYNGTIWTPSTDVGITGSGVSGQVSYWNGTNTQTGSNNLTWDSTNNILNGTELNFFDGTFNGDINIGTFSSNATVSSIVNVNSIRSFVPTSGVAQFIAFNYNGTINQTGGANGVSRGLLINPILTSAADWRSIEWTNNTGWGLYQTGTSLNYLNGSLLLGSTINSGQRLQVTGDTLLSGITTITPAALTGSGATSALSITQTWNTSGVPTLIFANVTNTGSNPSSLLMDLQVGGTSQFNVTRGGGVNCNGATFRQAGSQFTRNASATLPVLSINQTGNNSNTSGIINGLLVSLGASPTSGTLVHNHLTIEGSINQTGGANGITRGLYVNPTLTAAADWRSIEWSNNTGWGLYGAGTSLNYLGGRLAIGSTNFGSSVLAVRANLTGTTSQAGVLQSGTVLSDVTNTVRGFLNQLNTQAAAFSLFEYYHFDATQGTIGASSSVSNQYGFRAADSLTGATNNYGFYGNIASGTGRWNLYMNGTAANYLAGSLGIGTVLGLGDSTLRVGKNMTGGTTHTAIYNDGTIQTDVTTSGIYFRTQARTAASVAVTNVVHYYAQSLSLGAGSTVTNQFGYHAENNLIGATNNYGFYGNIAAGTGRWNLYMNGTAINYMNGSLLLGSTTDSGERLQVNGTMKVMGASSFGGNMAVGTSTATERLHLVDTTNGFVGLRLEGTGTYAGSDFSIYASSTTPSSANDFLGIYNNSATDGATVGYKMQIFKSGAATFASSITSASLSTGVGTFSGNSIITLNQNGATRLSISNTTSGTGSFAETSYISNATSGQLQVGKLSSLYSGYKTTLANDSYIFNNNIAGNISILNDFASGNINFAAGGSSTAQWTIGSNGDLTAADGENIIVGSTNGTKLGTATSQKIGFWNATPIVQPTTAVASATRVGGAGNTVTDTDTYDGYTLPQIVKALRNAGLLA